MTIDLHSLTKEWVYPPCEKNALKLHAADNMKEIIYKLGSQKYSLNSALKV